MGSKFESNRRGRGFLAVEQVDRRGLVLNAKKGLMEMNYRIATCSVLALFCYTVIKKNWLL